MATFILYSFKQFKLLLEMSLLRSDFSFTELLRTKSVYPNMLSMPEQPYIQLLRKWNIGIPLLSELFQILPKIRLQYKPM